MRIIYVITDLSLGGAELQLYKIAQKLRKDSDVKVISLLSKGNLGDDLIKLGVELSVVNFRKKRFFFYNFFKLCNLILDFKPDVVHCWMYHANLVIYLMKFFLGNKISYVWNIRHTPVNLESETFLTSYLIKIKSYLSSQVDKIIYNSNKSKSYHEGIGYSKKNGIVIPNGFDGKIFKISSKIKLKKRKIYNIGANDIVFGHFARFHPMKNHKMFIEVANIISSKIKNCKFLMAGNNINKNNLNLSKLINQYKLKDKILLIDEISDLHNFYPMLDFFCLTSSWGESFPNVLGEAMACGVTCVSTNIGDSKLIIGNTGKCVIPNNKVVFSNACLDLINCSLKYKSKINYAAREQILKKYNIELIVHEYLKLYKKCIKNGI